MAKKNNSRTPVLQQLVVKAPQRRSADVGTWRTALRSADNGRVKTLYDLFDDLLLDGVLSDAMQKRIDAVCNSELSFTNADGEEVEDITNLIDTLGFEDMLREILKQRFYGRSGFAMEFPVDGGLIVHAIPAKHINLAGKIILPSKRVNICLYLICKTSEIGTTRTCREFFSSKNSAIRRYYTYYSIGSTNVYAYSICCFHIITFTLYMQRY